MQLKFRSQKSYSANTTPTEKLFRNFFPNRESVTIQFTIVTNRDTPLPGALRDRIWPISTKQLIGHLAFF